MSKTISKSKAKVEGSLTEKKYDAKTWRSWYETMLRIRKFEEKTLLMYSQQKIRGFCHVYIGQKAIAGGMVTVRFLLRSYARRQSPGKTVAGSALEGAWSLPAAARTTRCFAVG